MATVVDRLIRTCIWTTNADVICMIRQRRHEIGHDRRKEIESRLSDFLLCACLLNVARRSPKQLRTDPKFLEHLSVVCNPDPRFKIFHLLLPIRDFAPQSVHLPSPEIIWSQFDFSSAPVSLVAVGNGPKYIAECFPPRVKTPSFRGVACIPIAEVEGPREEVVREVKKLVRACPLPFLNPEAALFQHGSFP